MRLGLAIGSGALLQPGTVTMLQTPPLLTSGEETEYGLGWMREEVLVAGDPTLLANPASRTLLGGATSVITFPARGMVVAATSRIFLTRFRARS